MKPEKLECIGHAQKRMGTRLRNIVKSYKGTKTPLHGKNRLTESIINSMQNFYGLAIRRNTNSLYAMKKATVEQSCTIVLIFKMQNFGTSFVQEQRKHGANGSMIN